MARLFKLPLTLVTFILDSIEIPLAQAASFPAARSNRSPTFSLGLGGLSLSTYCSCHNFGRYLPQRVTIVEDATLPRLLRRPPPPCLSGVVLLALSAVYSYRHQHRHHYRQQYIMSRVAEPLPDDVYNFAVSLPLLVLRRGPQLFVICFADSDEVVWVRGLKTGIVDDVLGSSRAA
ncbi:hypothetical protein GALMADRAFT_149328 [Galerina marginata CBS 339.88]|uniref:Uncharacterized protein n=1 Tax=Galerina marginata (strain CBS 339.88) TaxID=685588 RepID=A0A067U0A3_GALM3|nr:hypothetical protein GALMADRAFT_149328 [Galerina marginata CBS 339.88]